MRVFTGHILLRNNSKTAAIEAAPKSSSRFTSSLLGRCCFSYGSIFNTISCSCDYGHYALSTSICTANSLSGIWFPVTRFIRTPCCVIRPCYSFAGPPVPGDMPGNNQRWGYFLRSAVFLIMPTLPGAGAAEITTALSYLVEESGPLCRAPVPCVGAGAVWKSAHLAGRRCCVEIRPPLPGAGAVWNCQNDLAGRRCRGKCRVHRRNSCQGPVSAGNLAGRRCRVEIHPPLPGAGAVWKSAHLAGRRCCVEIRPPCRAPVLCGNPPPTLPGAGAVWKSAHLAGRRCRVEIRPPCRAPVPCGNPPTLPGAGAVWNPPTLPGAVLCGNSPIFMSEKFVK